jgi:hypothetical protein
MIDYTTSINQRLKNTMAELLGVNVTAAEPGHHASKETTPWQRCASERSLPARARPT